MKIGDIVRLKQPFKPEPDCLEEYRYGVVIGLVETDRDSTGAQPRSRLSEVILQLYNPETAIVYTDGFGTRPMFYFRIDELELQGDGL